MRMLAISSETYLQDTINLIKQGEESIVFVADDGYSVTVNFQPYDYDYTDEEMAEVIEQFVEESMEENPKGNYDA